MLTEERRKQLMTDLGMPNSQSLYSALQQVANEVEQATRAEVRAEAQEPVARVREHDDYQATIDWLLNPLPDCTVLFDSQQPPAPCPKCAELELKVKSIRSETLAKEEQTADGFWSLYQTEKAANKILQSEVERLPARRAQPTVKTSPIAQPNLAFFGISETDEEFAERAGRKVEGVAR